MEPHPRQRATLRKVRAAWRDTFVLLREFRIPLVFFLVVIVGSGLLYYQLSQNSANPVQSPLEAIYLTLTLTFLQGFGDFPSLWYLQIFFFLMPVIGVIILAQGLADFGVLLFNRRSRGKEWEIAVASTFNRHTVLVGLGHLGYRVVKSLCEMDEDVVVIEIDPKPDLLKDVHFLNVPIIQEDATHETAMQSVRVAYAKSIILCTQNDSLNLQMAVKARSLNPDIEVIIRIFDDDFAQALQKQFGFRALSATGMAAPVFAALAANIDITPPISIEGEPNSLARVQINPDSTLCGSSIDHCENQYKISVVRYNNQQGRTYFHPEGKLTIQTGDTLTILGNPEHIARIIQANK
jgi:voltage-gated potassium channel